MHAARSFFAVLFFASLVACAKGSEFTGSGPSAGAAGGDGGAGATGGSGGAPNGGGGNPSVGGNPNVGGQGGAPCSEDPCKLVAPQCGCADGEKCTLNGSGDRACGPAGTAAVAAQCDANQDCAPGAICLGEASVGYCAPFCEADTDCTGGTICGVLLNDGMGGVLEDVAMCSSACNLVTAAGCPSGLGCILAREADGLQRWFSMCFAAQSGTTGAACPTPDLCAPGYGCYNTGMTDQCFQNCDVNNPQCDAGTCVPIQDDLMQNIVLGGISLGACAP